MNLYEWFFPEHAKMESLQEIASEQRRANLRRERTELDLDRRVGRLEEHIGFLALLLNSALDHLNQNRVLAKETILDDVSKMDEFERIKEGKVVVETLIESRVESDVAEALGLVDTNIETVEQEIQRLKERLKELE